MGYRQYTHCVSPADYVDNVPPSGAGAILLALLTDPTAVAKWAAAFCPYLLGGKLVCLGDGEDQCAIGHITHFEPASQKPFPDNLDNDFSMNILLAPHDIGEMAKRSYLENYNAVAKDGEQGWLLQEQPYMPVPRQSGEPGDGSPPDPIPSPRYQGYVTSYPDSNYAHYDPSQNPPQVHGSNGTPFYVPCLHVECEGSRIHDVCAAISAVQGPLSAFCDVPLFGPLLCLAADIVMWPVLATAVAAAWALASDGDAADAEVGGSGTLELGDLIIVTGRWVYDAGHQGWNEFHPVKTIQLICTPDYEPDFAQWRLRWCEATAHCPPYAPPGTRPTGMTSAQTTTYESQLNPNNQWIYHPLIDGCDPEPDGSNQ